ncbi:hypothetical protein PILCRDRAFT_439222 [Piloderma croceum F 1598]|uniref:Uncharacterized protein n=1 Tax=Piloderma croceum (strain F 1598) TaxID=765440 RepID=A0A0C3C131_PILCF|nr:hypothetical protein PILCRDRAFT_439222 [Piloderma croceum F 1598]
MTFSFAGLGIMSIQRSIAHWSDIIHGKGEIRSIFFALLLFVVVLVLAYLTNPSENSFRTFLTEQSFRQHLSRLDYTNEDEHCDPEDARDAYSLIRKGRLYRKPCTSTGNGNGNNNNDHPFHFANRASVSLRTPKHVFHSFGVCTIAAVVPFPTGSGAGHGIDQDTSTILDSWFIGAFGRWWRGGVLEAWYRDVVHRAKDEEGWSSGILGFKALDKLGDYNGFPFSKTNLQHRLPVRGSPPKLRNRERSLSRRLGGPPPRSSTPPPLPKSASLPLHATRLPSSSSSTLDHRHAQVDNRSTNTPQSQSHPQRSISPTPLSSLATPVLSRTSSALLDQSPIIAEVLRQISSSKTTVHELRTQLNEFQSAASESHASLQSEVDSYRERRRQEEAARVELKAKTKTLEDSKRHAESHKRDAEKRLKAAQSARDECTQRMAHLDSEITRLEQRSVDDQASTEQSKVDTAKAEQEISDALERKKQEIKVAEEVIAALGVRAKELEERLVGERERLRLVREQAEIRKQDQSFFPLHVVNPDNAAVWSPIAFGPSPGDAALAEYLDGYKDHDADVIGNNGNGNGNAESESRDISRSPRPARLSLGGISNFSGQCSDTSHASLRSKGYSIFDDDIASLQSQSQAHTTNFSPFEDTDAPSHKHHGSVLPPTSSGLMPTGLMDTRSESLSRSFQSENDAYLDKDWRGLRGLHSQAVDNQVRQPVHMRSDSMNMQRATMPAPNRTRSDPAAIAQEEDHIEVDRAERRRWFSSPLRERPKKGLNPDAKVFRFTKPPTEFGVIGGNGAATAPPSHPGNLTFDALNPNGLASHVMTATSSNTSSLLRAFAPSPAEREVLQRALGGSTNPSLERLPSLSRVGSIPSSPSHVHAVVTGHSRPTSSHLERGEVGKNLPSWLQSLPRIGKPNFSPWEDDEPASNGGNGAGH